MRDNELILFHLPRHGDSKGDRRIFYIMWHRDEEISQRYCVKKEIEKIRTNQKFTSSPPPPPKKNGGGGENSCLGGVSKVKVHVVWPDNSE